MDCPIFRIMAQVILVGWEVVEAPRIWEKVEAVVPEGPEARVGNDASSSIISTSTSRDVSTRAALFLSSFSRVYSTYICQMSMEDMGVTSMYLFSSQGTPTRWHSFVFRTEKERDIWRFLAPIDISCPIISPKLSRLLALIDPR